MIDKELGVVVWNDNIKNRDELVRLIIENSNMTWFFSPIKSTDTNSALLHINENVPVLNNLCNFLAKCT